MDPVGPELAEIRSLAQRSQGLLEKLRTKTTQSDHERREGVERVGDEATRLIEQIAASIAGELAEQQEQRSQDQRQEIDQQRAELEQQRAEWEAQRSEWESVRDEIERELAQREQAIREQQDARLHEANESSAAERDQLEEHVRGLTQQVEQQREEIDRLGSDLTQSRQQESAQVELLEKFDIALSDLQAHRERVAELEDQLAERPEASGADSAELAQLRQERDELASQIAHLEAAGGGATPLDGPEEIADLRRRFELAVEDVRALKDEKARLEERLANGSSGGEDLGGNDWESQKRRLLAELEGEGEPQSAERAEERATIAGTIQITDGVVADKDREIAELRERLEQSAEHGSDEAAADAAADALIDTDEVIRAERERLATLEADWEEKLRQAELELSVERAKIARSQNELAEQQLELETLRAAVERAASESTAPGEARQKWFRKLGLSSDGKS